MAKLLLATLLILPLFLLQLLPPSSACNCTYPPKHGHRPQKHPPHPPPHHAFPPIPPIVRPPPVVHPPFPPIVRPPPIPFPPPSGGGPGGPGGPGGGQCPPSPPTVPVIPPPTPPAPVVPAPPRPPKTCPIDVLKLYACVDALGGLVHIGIGRQAKDVCCPLIQGLLDIDAALCLCTTIRARLLNINIFLPLALELLITCGKHPPPGFQCPPLI